MPYAVVAFPILALAISGLLGVLAAFRIARRLGRLLNFRSLLIVNYVLVMQVSGIVHLLQIPDISRGYFDVATVSGQSTLGRATIGSILGLLAVSIACLQHLPSARSGTSDSIPTPPPLPSTWLLPAERQVLIAASLILLPVTLYASQRVRAFAAGADQARIITVDGGLARFSYLSGWLVWVISFLAIWLVGTRLGRSRPLTLTIASVSLVATVLSLAWNGGRSIVVVMALPLGLVLLPLLRGVRWVAVPAAIFAVAEYAVSVTRVRSTAQAYDTLTVASLLDWQWGRFSMLGFSVKYVEEHGTIDGETFGSALASIAAGLAHLLGIGTTAVAQRSSLEVIGQVLGTEVGGVNYIVPGLTAEFYLNFGMVGIVVGCYLLGRITNWVDKRFSEASSPMVQLAFAYLGTLIVLRTITAESSATLTYVLYTGAPVLLAGWLSFRIRRRANDTVASRAMTKRTVAVDHR
jgi:hypothetical protein